MEPPEEYAAVHLYSQPPDCHAQQQQEEEQQ